ncbi:hypothetical protein TIFTF001_001800 [Ficus carica]|uniref:KIB1-4 beta-propeller domain-containing protein n=1 Tax=Ficus carica TaxID=3494 RepID=A0AA87Z8Q9_FICCA|nr:hypothetical protein TIFTF001_001800 [Ficus carica]
MITADPLTNPDQCIVMVISSNHKLAFIRPARDTTWTSINSEQFGVAEEILYCNDQFYVLTCGGKLESFRITESSISDVELVTNNRPEFTGKSYLVETHENNGGICSGLMLQTVAEGDLTIVKRVTTSHSL